MWKRTRAPAGSVCSSVDGGRHAGGEGERAAGRAAAFDRRQRLLEAVLGRIAFALIEPAVERLRLRSVEKGGGEVDRRRDRAGLPVGLAAGVHGERLEAHGGESNRPGAPPGGAL